MAYSKVLLQDSKTNCMEKNLQWRTDSRSSGQGINMSCGKFKTDFTQARKLNLPWASRIQLTRASYMNV